MFWHALMRGTRRFPYAVVNVQQGGSGTTGEVLRSDRPMLVVPYGWDQADNATRVQRLGVGIHIAPNAYTVDTASSALMKLLKDVHFARNAAEVRARLAAENELATDCTAIESIFTHVDYAK